MAHNAAICYWHGFIFVIYRWKHRSCFVSIPELNNAALWPTYLKIRTQIYSFNVQFEIRSKRITGWLISPRSFCALNWVIWVSGGVIVRLVKHSDLFLWQKTWPVLRTQKLEDLLSEIAEPEVWFWWLFGFTRDATRSLEWMWKNGPSQRGSVLWDFCKDFSIKSTSLQLYFVQCTVKRHFVMHIHNITILWDCVSF